MPSVDPTVDSATQLGHSLRLGYSDTLYLYFTQLCLVCFTLPGHSTQFGYSDTQLGNSDGLPVTENSLIRHYSNQFAILGRPGGNPSSGHLIGFYSY